MGIKTQYQQVQGANSAGFALGLFIGATTGALVGMLLGPKSGNQMLQKLRGLANQGTHSLKKGWEDVRSKTIEVSRAKQQRISNDVIEKNGIYTDNISDASDIFANQVKSEQDPLHIRI